MGSIETRLRKETETGEDKTGARDVRRQDRQDVD